MAAVEWSEQGGHFPVELNGGVATSELPVGLAEIINVKALNPAHPVAGHLSDVSLSSPCGSKNTFSPYSNSRILWNC